jgi:hypothetical protein
MRVLVLFKEFNVVKIGLPPAGYDDMGTDNGILRENMDIIKKVVDSYICVEMTRQKKTKIESEPKEKVNAKRGRPDDDGNGSAWVNVPGPDEDTAGVEEDIPLDRDTSPPSRKSSRGDSRIPSGRKLNIPGAGRGRAGLVLKGGPEFMDDIEFYMYFRDTKLTSWEKEDGVFAIAGIISRYDINMIMLYDADPTKRMADVVESKDFASFCGVFAAFPMLTDGMIMTSFYSTLNNDGSFNRGVNIYGHSKKVVSSRSIFRNLRKTPFDTPIGKSNVACVSGVRFFGRELLVKTPTEILIILDNSGYKFINLTGQVDGSPSGQKVLRAPLLKKMLSASGILSDKLSDRPFDNPSYLRILLIYIFSRRIGIGLQNADISYLQLFWKALELPKIEVVETAPVWFTNIVPKLDSLASLKIYKSFFCKYDRGDSEQLFGKVYTLLGQERSENYESLQKHLTMLRLTNTNTAIIEAYFKHDQHSTPVKMQANKEPDTEPRVMSKPASASKKPPSKNSTKTRPPERTIVVPAPAPAPTQTTALAPAPAPARPTPTPTPTPVAPSGQDETALKSTIKEVINDPDILKYIETINIYACIKLFTLKGFKERVTGKFKGTGTDLSIFFDILDLFL